MGTSLRDEIRRRPNSHVALTEAFEAATCVAWHAPTPTAAGIGPCRSVSVVIPAHENGYSLAAVLDALSLQHHADTFEVVVVDDSSHDGTAEIAATHPVVDRAVQLRHRTGAAAARNVGTALVGGEVVVYLDADIVLPAHAIGDVAARANDETVLVGFRHNVPYEVHQAGMAVPTGAPDLCADRRVTWRPPAGVVLPYSGITLDEPLEAHLLDDTNDLVDLGHGRYYYDWDLPRMVVAAIVAMPRAAVIEVGGYEHEFGRLGWGLEDTYLGACLVAAHLLVVPLRQLVGFHLDPPDAGALWQTKLAAWPKTLDLYRSLLDEPVRRGRAAAFATTTSALLAECTVLR